MAKDTDIQNTKIVATLGPSSQGRETIRGLVCEGVDVFRLNFSHGEPEEHRKTVTLIREICAELDTDVAIMQDLSGPKIRTGPMEGGQVELVTGEEVTITTEDIPGTATRFGTNYDSFLKDISAGCRVLLNDGAMELEVVKCTSSEAACKIVHGGTLKSNKGINLPGTHISAPSVTEKDREDLATGIELGVDFVALSFVREADDVREIKDFLSDQNCRAQVIAKIEKAEAMSCIDEIVGAADGVLVARGDLGVEMDLAVIPLLQKSIIRLANEQDKYVIVATQMLESMIHSARPTRAEVSDVTNAIIDGADAVMLSGETAIGKFPMEAVRIVNRVAQTTEEHLASNRALWDWDRVNPVHAVQDAIGHAAYRLCEDLGAGAIVTYSPTGGTALFLSKSRPKAPIIAFTPAADAFRRMRIFWGVRPVLDTSVSDRDGLLTAARAYIAEQGVGSKGAPILLVAGSHFGSVGSTNTIEVADGG